MESQPQKESYIEVIPKIHSKVWNHFKLTNEKAKYTYSLWININMYINC